MPAIDLARTYFDQGFSCSQAVSAAFAAEFGLDAATMLRVASTFGGGIARSGDTCGAISGALMVLGLKYGATQPDPAAKERAYEHGREFIARFRARNGAVDCRDLLGHDFATPEGRAAIKETKIIRTICPALVASAVEILEEMQIASQSDGAS
jgi:C_GCAxxG_C_C family probable redox protein